MNEGCCYHIKIYIYFFKTAVTAYPSICKHAKTNKKMLEMADIILHNSNSREVNPSTSMTANENTDVECCIRTMSFKTLATHHFSSACLWKRSQSEHGPNTNVFTRVPFRHIAITLNSDILYMVDVARRECMHIQNPVKLYMISGGQLEKL